MNQADLPEPSTVPHSITMVEGKIAIYVEDDTGALRCFWDSKAKALTRDDSWEAKPQRPGQTTSDAQSILGDWIVLQTNGLVSKTASSIVTIQTTGERKARPGGLPLALRLSEWLGSFYRSIVSVSVYLDT